jgi:putative transcriptional regulator
MINNHPSPEMLMDYSSGSLKLSHALCIATHIEGCAVCAQQVRKMTRIGGLLFDQQKSNVLSPKTDTELKNKVMAMLDHQPSQQSTENNELAEVKGSTVSNDNVYKVPRSLRQFIDNNYDQLSWKSLSPSIKVSELCRDKDGSKIALTRVKPGGKMPNHSHTGDEITLVLEGSFSDEDGQYKKGDFLFHISDEKHTPIVSKDAECICLTVLDAPIQFTGFFTRWLNPLLRLNHAY